MLKLSSVIALAGAFLAGALVLAGVEGPPPLGFAGVAAGLVGAAFALSRGK